MKKIILTALLLIAGHAVKAQGLGAYIDDNDGEWTNVRNAPKGKIVAKLPAKEGVMITLNKSVDGWWCLYDNTYWTGDGGGELTGSTTDYWLHWSVVVVGTRNYGGQKLTLRKSPSTKAAAVYSFTEEKQLHPIDMKGDWVKVRTADKKYTGWIEREWLCGNSLTNCC